MDKKISVKKAIARAWFWVEFMPIFLNIALSLIGIGFLIAFPPKSGQILAIIVVVIVLFSHATGFISHYIFIKKWKIWAFGHVTNTTELKKWAILKKLIKPEDKIPEVAADSSTYAKRHQTMEKLYEHPDVFQDDNSVPSETLLYHWHKQYLHFILIFFIIIAVGIFFLTAFGGAERYFVSGALIFTGIFGAYYFYRKYRLTALSPYLDPFIIINDNGIRTKASFYPWEDIENEYVINKRNARNPLFELIFALKQQKKQINIPLRHISITPTQILKLLIIYRGRNTRNG